MVCSSEDNAAAELDFYSRNKEISLSYFVTVVVSEDAVKKAVITCYRVDIWSRLPSL